MAEVQDRGKLYYAGVFRNDPKPAFELTSQRDVHYFSYWQRQSVSEFLTFFSKTVVERSHPGKRQMVEEQGNVIYSLARPDGLAGVVITDRDYPALTAHQLVTMILEAYTDKIPKSTWSKSASATSVPGIETLFEQYKHSSKVKGIAAIQEELDQTKAVLHKTIENVLERGEKLDTLVAKSEGLNFASRNFYTQAKKQNSCCAVM